MPTIEQIETTIGYGKNYSLFLGAKYLTLLEKGCEPDMCNLYSLQDTITALQMQVDVEVVDEDTITLYKCLKQAIAGYSVPFVIDPNVVIPGTDIIVENPAAYLEPIIIEWGDMSTDNSIDGGLGRTTYYNTEWLNVNPFMQLENTAWLYRGQDYDLVPTGGFELRADGQKPALYEGEKLIVVNYQFA